MLLNRSAPEELFDLRFLTRSRMFLRETGIKLKDSSVLVPMKSEKEFPGKWFWSMLAAKSGPTVLKKLLNPLAIVRGSEDGDGWAAAGELGGGGIKKEEGSEEESLLLPVT